MGELLITPPVLVFSLRAVLLRRGAQGCAAAHRPRHADRARPRFPRFAASAWATVGGWRGVFRLRQHACFPASRRALPRRRRPPPRPHLPRPADEVGKRESLPRTNSFPSRRGERIPAAGVVWKAPRGADESPSHRRVAAGREACRRRARRRLVDLDRHSSLHMFTPAQTRRHHLFSQTQHCIEIPVVIQQTRRA